MLHTDLPAGRGTLAEVLTAAFVAHWRVYVYDADQWQPGSSAYNTPDQAKQRQRGLAARWPDMPTVIVRETRTYQAEED